MSHAPSAAAASRALQAFRRRTTSVSRPCVTARAQTSFSTTEVTKPLVAAPSEGTHLPGGAQLFDLLPVKHGPTATIQSSIRAVVPVHPEQVGAVLDKLEALVADPAKTGELLGDGWTLARVDRQFVRDSAGPGWRRVRRRAGPSPRKISDTYFDTGGSPGAVRVRKLEGQDFSNISFRPKATGDEPMTRVGNSGLTTTGERQRRDEPARQPRRHRLSGSGQPGSAVREQWPEQRQRPGKITTSGCPLQRLPRPSGRTPRAFSRRSIQDLRLRL